MVWLYGLIATACGLSTFLASLKLYELQHEVNPYVRALWVIPSVLIVIGSALFGCFA